ncbi:mobile element protein [Streptomyces sp. L-9-10]|nr:mobile element protein [Streptomyces sp. L-9-10]
MPAEPPTPSEAENAALRKKVRGLEEERAILPDLRRRPASNS